LGMTYTKIILAADWNSHPLEHPKCQKTVQDGRVIEGSQKTARTLLVWAIIRLEFASSVCAERVIAYFGLPMHSVLEIDFKLQGIKEDIATFSYAAQYDEEEGYTAEEHDFQSLNKKQKTIRNAQRKPAQRRANQRLKGSLRTTRQNNFGKPRLNNLTNILKKKKKSSIEPMKYGPTPLNIF
jgi:hypothetical protein